MGAGHALPAHGEPVEPYEAVSPELE